MTKETLLKHLEHIPNNAEMCSVRKMEFMNSFIDVITPAFVKYDKESNRIIISC